MTTIKVNPQAINEYAKTASAEFSNMATELGAIVADVDGLQYTGANAKEFKAACAEIAAEYVTFMNEQLTNMGRAVVGATKNIERALGGDIINFEFEDINVSTSIGDAGGEVVEIDSENFAQSKSAIEGHFDGMVNALTNHRSAFVTASAEWQGAAHDVAAEAVESITKSATAKTEETKQQISEFMGNQNESATTADASLVAAG